MADESNLIDKDEIQRLIQQSSSQDGAPAEDRQKDAESQGSSGSSLDQSDLEALLGGGGQKSEEAAAESPSQTPTVNTSDAAGLDNADKPLKQDDLEQLLGQAGTAAPPESRQPVPRGRASESSLPGEGDLPQGDVEYLLNQAERALGSIDSGEASSLPAGVTPFQFEEFLGTPASTENATLDLITDVELDLRIELGRTNMYLEDVLKLRKGSVVPLDKLAGDPVDIYVNERLIARGEVLVLNDNFCVRVGELIAGSNRPG